MGAYMCMRMKKQHVFDDSAVKHGSIYLRIDDGLKERFYAICAQYKIVPAEVMRTLISEFLTRDDLLKRLTPEVNGVKTRRLYG